MWNDFQYENWFDRGQSPTISNRKADLEKFERLKREAGVI
jgi:hypothetical protein